MGFFSRISTGLDSVALNEDDVTVQVKDTDAETEAADSEGAADAVEDAADDTTTPATEDADTQADVNNTPEKPIVPMSGDGAAPDDETSNAEVQSEVEEEEEADEEATDTPAAASSSSDAAVKDGPVDAAEAFDPAADTTVKVEEAEDQGAIRNQELADPTAAATALATDGAQAASEFSNVGDNDITKGEADADNDDAAVSEGYSYDGFDADVAVLNEDVSHIVEDITELSA